MILDAYWKRELDASIHMLKFWKRISTIFATDYVKHKINKHILLMAVVARKMVDDELWAKNEIAHSSLPMPKLPLIEYKVSVTEYPFIGEKEWLAPGNIIASDYGRALGEEKILLNKICSQIIHSFEWSVVGISGKKGFVGFVVASDREKERGIFYVSIDEWIDAMIFCIENASV